VGFLKKHGKLIMSYALLAGLGVVGGRDFALTANAATDPHAFTITSSNVTGIAPGKPMTFPVLVSNPSTQDVKLLTLTTMVTLQTAPKGAPPCDVSKLTVAPYNSGDPGARQYVVPSRGSTTVPLTITLADTSTNQDGCKSRKFTLTYSGTAEQVH